MAARSDDARRRILAEVQNIIQDNVAIAGVHFKKQITGWSPSLDGFRPLPTSGFVLDRVQS
ncbi:MAG: hypothetical protein V7607_5680 [Solirubrobacteraceae bacterium]